MPRSEKESKLTVEQYIDGIKDQGLRNTVRKLRIIIVKSLPTAEEQVKWGMPYYSINGEGVVSIAEYAKHVNLYFFSGARLSSKLLEGTGRGMRHIKIGAASEIKLRELSPILREAANLTKNSLV